MVWFRRLRPVKLPEELPANDRAIAETEFRYFMEGLWWLLDRNCFCVNPVSGRLRSSNKLLQLTVAARVGWNLPPTIFSHNPEKIRAFFHEHQESGVVYKPFHPYVWHHEDGRVEATHTAVVRASDLDDSAGLHLCPGIYQKRIAKRSELRVTVFGGKFFAVEITPKGGRWASVDWRDDYQAVQYRRVDLDPAVKELCQRLMDHLGIVFGCFDIAIDEEGKAWFLEVNEMGQFLWLDLAIPDLAIMQHFACFLAGRGNPDVMARADDLPPPVEVLREESFYEFSREKGFSIRRSPRN